MDDRDDNRWVKDCALYLIETRYREAFYNRPSVASLNGHPAKDDCIFNFEQMNEELKSLQQDAARVMKRLNKLRGHLELGHLVPFEAVAPRIQQAATAVTDAQVQIFCAAQELHASHPATTRALTLQKSAVRLAYANWAVSKPRKIRAFAKKIILESGLEEVDESTLSAWLKEIRDEDMRSSQPEA